MSEQVKILIIDDDQSIRDILEKIISRLFPDIIVDLAVDGNEGRQKLLEGGYKFFISDLIMPGASGKELLYEFGDQIPCVLMSGNSRELEAISSTNPLGLAECMKKPFPDIQNLRVLIGKLLQAS